MRERALSFGPARLVGILTEPAPEDVDRSLPTVVILNSGILHRTGASRLYVRIARALAQIGVTTLRFDFSGVGDSDVRPETMPIEERFRLETREAMDYLTEHFGSERFVLGGLCSGADGAYWTAVDDPRVVGVWQIDGFCYRTLGYYRRRYGPKVVSPSAWARWITHRLRPRDTSPPIGDGQFVRSEYRRVLPPKQQVEGGLGALLERGVRLYFFFTDGLDEYNYPDQHADAFRSIDLGGRAQVRYVPGATHLITDLGHQDILLDDMTDWMREFATDTP